MQANKYIIKTDEQNNILYSADTFNYTVDDFEITREEFEKVPMYKKFNPITKEFYEPVEVVEKEEGVSDRQRMEQVEEMVGMLAEQLAKQSLGM